MCGPMTPARCSCTTSRSGSPSRGSDDHELDLQLRQCMSDPGCTVHIVDRSPTRSIAIVFDEVRSERRMQLSHFDSLDSQAGIVLGFAGALVALTPGNAPGLATAGRWLAIASPVDVLAQALLEHRPASVPRQVPERRALVHGDPTARYTDRHDRAHGTDLEQQGRPPQDVDADAGERRAPRGHRSRLRLTSEVARGEGTRDATRTGNAPSG